MVHFLKIGFIKLSHRIAQHSNIKRKEQILYFKNILWKIPKFHHSSKNFFILTRKLHKNTLLLENDK